MTRKQKRKTVSPGLIGSPSIEYFFKPSLKPKFYGMKYGQDMIKAGRNHVL